MIGKEPTLKPNKEAILYNLVSEMEHTYGLKSEANTIFDSTLVNESSLLRRNLSKFVSKDFGDDLETEIFLCNGPELV